jgi:hypothetical protein
LSHGKKLHARARQIGGWGFERFLGSDTTPSLTEEHRKLCIECHDQRAEHDRVFSTFKRWP